MFKRVNSDVVPFSINSPAGNRYVFGTADVSNDIDANYNENIKKGFGTGPNEFPELEDFNALMFTGSYLASYLYQAGIPEWNDKQKYYINSIAMGSDGNIYRSLVGTEETPNVNNSPTLGGSVSWKSILSDYALINGDKTKRFKVADAEEDDEAVNLKQLNEASMNINTLPDKITPDNTDNLALQETGGLLKKLSWANLKATLFDGAISLTANGYLKFPSVMGGLIIQWGYQEWGSTTQAVIFPVAFPTATLNVQGTIGANSYLSENHTIYNLSTTGFKYSSPNSNYDLFWFAIGH